MGSVLHGELAPHLTGWRVLPKRPWLLCATSSRRCVCSALFRQREWGGGRTPRCSMRESCAPILHSHPARLRAGLGAAHRGRARPTIGSDRGKRDTASFVGRQFGCAGGSYFWSNTRQTLYKCKPLPSGYSDACKVFLVRCSSRTTFRSLPITILGISLR